MSRRERDLVSLAAVVGVLGLVFGGVADVYIHRYAIPFRAAGGIYCCFLMLLALVLAPGFAGVRDWLAPGPICHRARVPRNSLLLVIAWCIPYLIYAAGTLDFRWGAVGRLVTVAAPAALLYAIFPVKKPAEFEWQDLAVAVLLIWAVLSGALKTVWTVPVRLDFMTRLFLIAIGAWIWSLLRPVPARGYRFTVSGRVLRAAAANFFWFAIIAIPGGLLLGFTAWHPRWHGPAQFALDYVEIFLFVALLEELFFRGFLQSLLEGSFGSWWKAQILVSCLFGLFHILHAPFPNWRYVALATVAGWFYGSAFRAGGTIMASALVHAAVDAVWRTFLSKA